MTTNAGAEAIKNESAFGFQKPDEDAGYDNMKKKYVSSWVTDDMRRCFQVMECDDPALLEEWMSRWRDLTDFEVTPVVTSAAAVERIGPEL